MPCRRAIVALDIERPTSRPDPVKAELRTMLCELFDSALRSADIYPRHRDQFIDRGDGLLALIHPADRTPEALLVNQVVPDLSRLPTIMIGGSRASSAATPLSCTSAAEGSA